MSRLFAREEWRLATAGVLAGVLVLGLVLALWFRGLGAEPTLPTPRDTPGDTAGDPFVGALRRQVGDRLAARPVSTRPLRGNLSIRARDVVWLVPGSDERFARAEAVTGILDVSAANRGDMILRDVRMEAPRIALRSNGRTWNYERPLAGLLEDDGRDDARARRTPTFRIQGLVVSRGSATVDMPESDFALTGLEARFGTVDLSGPALAAPRMEVISARAVLDPPGDRPQLAVAAERGTLRFPDRVTEFRLSAVTVAGTRVEALEGSWNPSAPGYGVAATGRVPSVQLADVRFLAPERIPETGSASFRFAVEPLAGDGTAVRLSELSAASGESRIAGSLAAEIFPGEVAIEQVDLRLEPVSLALVESFLGRPLPYSGTLTGTLRGPGSDIDVDIVASLSSETSPTPFNINLLGGVALTRSGLALRDMRADLRGVPLAALRAVAPGLPLTGRVTGIVELNGSPGTTPLELDVRLELGTGLATVAGTVDLTGAIPRYDVSGRLVGIELQSVIASVPPVALTAQFALVGSGFDPATAVARVRLDGQFTGWRSEPGDTVAVVADVNGGTADFQQLRATLAGAELAASGRWRFVDPVSGAVEYRLAVASLEPFGPWVPMIGDSTATGSIAAQGTISGPLGALRLAGDFRGEQLRVGEWGAGRIASRYTAAFTGALPEIEATLEGGDVLTPTAGDYRTLTAEVRLVSPTFDLDVQGEHVAGGQVAIVAEGTIPREGSRTVNLQRAHFDLREGRWELAGPAQLTWQRGAAGLRVADFELRNPGTEGRVSLDGVVFPMDRLDARVVTTDLPLDQVQDLMGLPPRVQGRLWADVAIRPPAESPDIEGSFRLEQAVIDSVRFSQLEGRIDLSGGVARTELLAAIDTAGGRLELRGTVPLRISFADSLQFGLGDAGPLDATLVAERISLHPLAPFITRVRNLQGTVDGTLTLAGTAQDPRLGGQLALSGGSVVVPDLNQTFDSIAGIVSFSGRQAEFRDVRLHRDGWARLNGTATFQELSRPVFALVADLDEFQPMGVDQHPDAAVSGRVTLDGELDALVFSGNILIDDGYLAVPQFGRAFEDEFIDFMDPTPLLGVDAERGSGNWMSNLRIVDLRARFGPGAWFEAMDATAQLSGELTVNRAGDDLRILGTLRGERGSYTLAAGPIVRRFEVVNAQVRFLNDPEPNPAIDITARRVLLDETGRRVEVDVRITGTMKTPRLALASADAPDIPESELLSFLLFGRPTFALGQDVAATGTDLFEQTFLGGFAELASLELERSLSGDLGLQLDLFQIQFGQGWSGITSPTLVVGRQLSNDFFLTLETGLGALLGDEGATANHWAVRLEWAIDRRSSLRASYEPVNRARLLRGFGAALPPVQAQRQLYVEYRRRWVY